jgi:hypothetical protein
MKVWRVKVAWTNTQLVREFSLEAENQEQAQEQARQILGIDLESWNSGRITKYVTEDPGSKPITEDTDMYDETEQVRRQMVDKINAEPGSREALEAQYGQVWNTEELTRDFTVEGFAAPFVVVVRKADGKKGSMMFQHSPRFYFKFGEA